LGFKEIFVVPAGLNFPPLHEVPEKESYPVVAYVGRLKKAKRPDHVVKAFKSVKEEMPEAELWIIGDGYFRKDLEKIAGDETKFFGHVSEKDKIKLLSRAWILINPSIREGWGINVIEANACGTPCIAYDVSGLRDSIVNGKTGLLVKENGNVEKLAETMIRVLEDGDLRDKLNKNALEHSKRFSWDKSAEEFLKVIIGIGVI